MEAEDHFGREHLGPWEGILKQEEDKYFLITGGIRQEVNVLYIPLGAAHTYETAVNREVRIRGRKRIKQESGNIREIIDARQIEIIENTGHLDIPISSPEPFSLPPQPEVWRGVLQQDPQGGYLLVSPEETRKVNFLGMRIFLDADPLRHYVGRIIEVFGQLDKDNYIIARSFESQSAPNSSEPEASSETQSPSVNPKGTSADPKDTSAWDAMSKEAAKLKPRPKKINARASSSPLSPETAGAVHAVEESPDYIEFAFENHFYFVERADLDGLTEEQVKAEINILLPESAVTGFEETYLRVMEMPTDSTGLTILRVGRPKSPSDSTTPEPGKRVINAHYLRPGERSNDALTPEKKEESAGTATKNSVAAPTTSDTSEKDQLRESDIGFSAQTSFAATEQPAHEEHRPNPLTESTIEIEPSYTPEKTNYTPNPLTESTIDFEGPWVGILSMPEEGNEGYEPNMYILQTEDGYSYKVVLDERESAEIDFPSLLNQRVRINGRTFGDPHLIYADSVVFVD